MKGWRGLAAGAMCLIALEAFTRGKGPEAGGQMLVWISQGLRAMMSADVAAIPTARTAPPAKASGGTPSTGGITGPLGISKNPTVTV